jgi:hypothetical protein
MKTISDLRNAFKTYVEGGRKWPQSIKSILNREMPRKSTRSNRRSRHGGAMAMGAPLTYTMTPGADVGVYGRFPTEMATNPQGIQDLDVFYASALSRGCGVENSSLKVPADMGSNKVGGRRSRGNRRRGGSPLASMMKDIGDTANSLTDRPYPSTAVPNMLQGAINTWKGNTTAIPTPSSPVEHTWNFYGDRQPGIIDPSNAMTSFGPTSYLASNYDTALPSAASPSAASPSSASASAPAPAPAPAPAQDGGRSRRVRRSRKHRGTHRRHRYHKK